MTWILNEDAAIKQKFNGLTVTGDGNAPPLGHDVAVRFRLPETELADATFPMVVIEHAGISKADDREHRGHTNLTYVPEGVDDQGIIVKDPETGLDVVWGVEGGTFDPNLSPFKVDDYPIPYNIDYQVTVYARLQNHLTELIAKLAVIDRIPARFGYVEIPQDGTVRTLDLLGGPMVEPDRDSDGKRVFRAVYSIRVVSELNLYEVRRFQTYVQSVDLQVNRIADTYE
jgi:hypothetical protein